MKFIDIFNESKIVETVEITKPKNKINEETKKPEEILRRAGFKIRLITPTSFGTQFDLAKKYDEDEINNLLKDFKIKIKDKSIFIVD